MRKHVIAALLLSVALVSATVCRAQTAGATITGRVADPKGDVVPDALIVAKNTDTGIERSTKSTSDGLYRFDNLPPGIYDLSVEVSGFAKVLAKGVKLQVGEQRDANFSLVLAGLTQQVVVTSEVSLVETTKTDVSSVIDDKQVSVLPTTTSFSLPGGTVAGQANDYSGLALLAPGVKYDFSNISNDLIGPGAVNDRGVLVNVDGGNISDSLVSTRDALGASLEEVREFQVLTNNYNAEYGQAGGVILNVITKSGANSFHGDGHAYFRGRNLTASTFFFNQSEESLTRRAPFHKFEGGFAVGGPFVQDRTFWFASYEQVRQGVPLTLVPPSGAITTSQPTKEILWSAKIDHRLNRNNQLSVRFNEQRDLSDNQLVQIAPIVTPESLVSQVVHDHTLNVGVTSTPTPHTVNEARFFWHHFLSETPTKSDMPGLEGPNFYHGAAFCCPQGALQNRYQYIDNFSWTHGAHTVKSGFNISRYPYFSLFTQINRGLYDFDLPETPTGGGRGPATAFSIGIGPAKVTSADTVYGFYVQDTWKLRRDLTLNYGLRYDLEVGAFQGGTILKGEQPGKGCFQGNGIIPACSSDHNNVQPRVGIAWSPNFQSGFLHTLFGDSDKTVIRASFAEITQIAYLNVVLDSLNFDGVNLLTLSGITDPKVLAFAPNRPPDSVLNSLRPVGFFGRVRPISDNLGNPESRHASLTISRQLTNTLVAELGYIGVFGFGLFGERDRNFPRVVEDIPANHPGIASNHPGFFYFTNRPDSRFTAVRTNENSRTSAYHAGYVRLTKRVSHHVQFQGSYTYSKLLASTEDFFGLSEPGDPRNIGAERALAQNDIRHMGQFGIVLDTERMSSRPFFKHLLNNWNFGVIGQVQSGRPYPLSTGDSPFSGSKFFGPGNETQQRPNVLPDGTLTSTNIAGRAGGTLLISPAGVAACREAGFTAAQCPSPTTFVAPSVASSSGPKDSLSGDIVDFQLVNGNLARNSGLGDPYTRFDISFIKAIRIPGHEQMGVELKVDVFNVFNHSNFVLTNGNDTLNALPIPPLEINGPTPGTMIRNPGFNRNCRSCLNPFNGLYVGADGRALKIQDLQHGRVDANITSPNWAGVGNPTATDIARTIQLSVRFKW